MKMEKLSLSNIKSKDYFVFTFEPSDIEKVIKDEDSKNTKVKFSNKIEYIKPPPPVVVKMFDDEFDEVFDDDNQKRVDSCNFNENRMSYSNDEFNNILILNDKKTRLVESVSIEKHGGLFNKRVFGIFILWYLFSALSLFSNKSILNKHEGSPL